VYIYNKDAMVTRSLNLTEAQVRYAMANTSSNAEAANWLNISFTAWKKYALSYYDPETGLSLFELHKQVGKEIRRKFPKTKYKSKTGRFGFQLYEMTDIFLNKHLKYSRGRFKYRLIHEGWKEERCDHCGYNDRRTTDYTVPLYLIAIDGNEKNYALENQEFCCFNCYYCIYGNKVGADKKLKIDDTTGEIVPAVPVRKTILAERIKKGPYFERKPHWGTKPIE